LDKELHNLIKRVEKNGIVITKPSHITRKMSIKSDVLVYNNRRMHETIIIDKEKLKKLLNTDFF